MPNTSSPVRNRNRARRWMQSMYPTFWRNVRIEP